MMKKILYIFICVFGNIINVFSQYSAPVVVDSFQSSIVYKLTHADFTNDGKEDIIISEFKYPFDRIKIYTNTGNNQFSSSVVSIADSITFLAALAAADINADGYADFVTISGTGKNTLLHWYENNNGNFIMHFIDTLIEGSSALILKDFDKDGKLDILAEEHHEITLRYQASPNTFSSKIIIHDNTEFYAIDAADYNNDGYLDVSVASGGFDVLINNTNKTFTLFSNAGTRLVFGIKSADLDNDQDIDIALYESLNGIMFYANDGLGNFIFKDTILYSTDNFNVFSLADLDCDNDIDLYTSIPQQGKMVWAKNSGNGNFMAYQTLHTQTGQLVKLTDVWDFNDDGKPDLIWGYKHLGLIINECSSTYLEQKDILSNIAVYPNPYTDYFYLENNHSEPVQYKVFDMMGKELYLGYIKEHSTLKLNYVSQPMVYVQMILANQSIYYKLLHSY